MCSTEYFLKSYRILEEEDLGLWQLEKIDNNNGTMSTWSLEDQTNQRRVAMIQHIK